MRIAYHTTGLEPKRESMKISGVKQDSKLANPFYVP